MTDLRNDEAVDSLKDGTPVVVRPIRPGDAAGVLAAFKSLDPQSIYTRFFAFKKTLTDAELKQITDVDPERVTALVVTIHKDGEERLVGGGRYFADFSARSAELAFLTDENYRGQGVASLVLRHLARTARGQGVLRFEADVLAENQAMLNVFRRSGLRTRDRPEGSVVHVTLYLNPLPIS